MKKQITLELTEEELIALEDAIRKSDDYYKNSIREIYGQLIEYELDFAIDEEN